MAATTDTTRCSACNTRKALPEHCLCRTCRDGGPGTLASDDIYMPGTARHQHERREDFIARFRREAHEGQQRLNAQRAAGR